MDEQNQEKEMLANSITKALAYTENGGKPNIENPSAGQSGEMKSIFQFEPKTWHAYSKEVTGQDDLPMTADSETYVVNQKVKQWIDEGKTASNIASLWNAGNPNAYKGNKGINSYGVAYDTPAYAKKVVKYSKEFYQESTNKSTNTTQSPTQNTTQSSPINDIMSMVNSAKSNQQTSQPSTNPPQQNSQGLIQGLLKQQGQKS